MANSRLRFLMPRRASGPSQQSSDLSAAPERSMDSELAGRARPDGAEFGRQRRVPRWAACETPSTLEEALG